MTLNDYLSLMETGDELTVWDEDYDMETYFYATIDANDRWQCAMLKLAEQLTVKTIRTNGVIVNLSEVIENHICELSKSDLFINCGINAIMNAMESVLAGNVSEDWMERFVDVLSE